MEKLDQKIFLKWLLAEVRCNNGTWVQANCFLDTGSNSSLVRLKFAKQLRLQGSGVSDVRFDVAGGGVHHEQAEEFEICIRPLHDDGRESYLILATGIKKPCSRVHPLTSEIFTSYEHLNEFRDKVHIRGGEVDLLIGNDYAPLIIVERCVSSPTSPDNSPSVAITRLGCYIYGYLNNPSSRAVNNILSINHDNRIEDTEELKTFFYGDVIGVKPTSLCVCSDNQISESAFIKHVQETTVINEEGRVCVQMPWKPGFPRKLPNNYFIAKEQMIRREKQLLKDGKLVDYNQEIKSLLVRGVVRILNLEEAEKGPKESSWYLNHRMIERPDKESIKLRIVFNSAAKCMGVSLNDAFEKGPDYTNSLFRCFLRWRMYRVAVSGDMEKMFNQISIMEHDQRYHRFLWQYGDIDSPILTFQWLRVLFGDKPSPDLAGYAIRFLAEDYKIVYPSGAEVLENSTYVDDIGYSVEDSKEAIKIAEEIDEILRHGKFSVKCWNSNGPNVDQYPNQIEVDVLGHTWNKEHDTIGVKPKELYVKEEDAITKRILMGLVARLWDPFGNLIPVTIKYRIHLQKIWQEGLDWDENISAEQAEIWREDIREIQKLQSFNISRCLKPEGVTGPPQLHAFSDGGNDAYGTCVFIRWPTLDGIQLKLAAAKAFIAPLKHKTIPRLELMGAVAMGRLIVEVETALTYQFEYKRFWTDSQVVIYWLQSTSNRYKPIISSRIQEFQDSHPNWMDEIRYVPSENNPADCLTKSISVEELSEWHQGKACEFLKVEKTLLSKKIPKKKKKKVESKKAGDKSDRNLILMNLNQSDAKLENEDLGSQIASTFSSWPELKRVISLIKQVFKIWDRSVLPYFFIHQKV